MNKIIKIFWNNIKIVLGLCLIVGTFYFGYNYLNSKFRNPEAYYNDSFHNLPEESMDVIVLGSSHAQYSFCPDFFYEDTGLYSYVLGSAFQPLKISYLMLKEALKTQSPEMIILEVYTATLGDEPINENRYVLAEYQLTGEERKEAISYLSDDKRVDYYNEFINNHNNWRNLSSIDDLRVDKTSIESTMGYHQNSVYLPVENYWYSFIYDEDVDVELKQEDLDALNNIYDLCKENDIEILLYMVPMDNVTVEIQSYRHKVWDWANEHDIKYIDFLERDTEFDIRSAIHSDGFHLYTNGASVVTDLLADYVKDNYVFDKHNENDTLNSLYDKGTDYLIFDALSSEYNVEKYINRIVTYPGIVMFKYSGDSQVDSIKNNLSKIGVDLVDGQAFYGIVYNGELVASSSTALEYNFNGVDIKINDSAIEFNGNVVDCNELLTFVVSKSDFSSYKKKVVSYIDGQPWEDGYDFNYNKVN